jgi:hypothetical protein
VQIKWLCRPKHLETESDAGSFNPLPFWNSLEMSFFCLTTAKAKWSFYTGEGLILPSIVNAAKEVNGKPEGNKLGNVCRPQQICGVLRNLNVTFADDGA